MSNFKPLKGYEREAVVLKQDPVKMPESTPPKQVTLSLDSRHTPFPLLTAISMYLNEGLDTLGVKVGVTIRKNGPTSYQIILERCD